jgi:hypothetical protein
MFERPVRARFAAVHFSLGDWVVAMRRRIRFTSVYLSVLAFATTMVLVDTWPEPPDTLIEWFLLFVMIVPVTLIGEWVSEGMLGSTLASAMGRGGRLPKLRWSRIAYYLTMCVLFATTTVLIFEWLTDD